jgi:hypothetical protein
LTISFYLFKLELLVGDRLMVGLQNLDLPIGVRIPVSQPINISIKGLQTGLRII